MIELRKTRFYVFLGLGGLPRLSSFSTSTIHLHSTIRQTLSVKKIYRFYTIILVTSENILQNKLILVKT